MCQPEEEQLPGSCGQIPTLAFDSFLIELLKKFTRQGFDQPFFKRLWFRCVSRVSPRGNDNNYRGFALQTLTLAFDQTFRKSCGSDVS